MKRLLLLPLVICSCQTRREVTMPNGATYRDGGHFAGDTTVMMEPDGTVILRNKMNAPWRDFLQAAVAIFWADRAADVAISNIAKQRATRLASQRAATARAASAAEIEKFRIATDLEKFRLLLPTQLPAGPP